MHGSPERPQTIVVVDDEHEIVDLLVCALRKAGYEVLGAYKPEDAFVLCTDRDRVVDLVVSDYSMPGQNGIQLANDLQRMRPKLEFVFMSASPVAFEESIAAGFVCLPKPFSFAELLEKIQERLDTAQCL